jgi:mannose-1-phosphate guanylyltransferase
MSTHIVGKGVMTNSSVNTHLINELNIPVCVLGVSNLIVATSPDGILVSEKEASPQIKEVLKDDTQRPMYEERRWGCYKVLDYTRNAIGEEVLTKRIIVGADKNFSYQYHLKRNEVWTVVSGQGELILDGELRLLNQGDVISIPAGSKHSVKAVTELEIIEVQMGSELVEEDIVRIEMEWTDIIQNCVNWGKTR